jgi:hypothetical protein
MRNEIIDHTNIKNYKLTIQHKNNHCILQYQNAFIKKQKKMDLKPPCYFVRKKNFKLQSFAYKNVGIEAVILVVGRLINNQIRKEWDLPKDKICGEEIQAILFKKKVIRLSKKVQKGGLFCRNIAVDEKNFWFFAHQ